MSRLKIKPGKTIGSRAAPVVRPDAILSHLDWRFEKVSEREKPFLSMLAKEVFTSNMRFGMFTTTTTLDDLVKVRTPTGNERFRKAALEDKLAMFSSDDDGEYLPTSILWFAVSDTHVFAAIITKIGTGKFLGWLYRLEDLGDQQADNFFPVQMEYDAEAGTLGCRAMPMLNDEPVTDAQGAQNMSLLIYAAMMYLEKNADNARDTNHYMPGVQSAALVDVNILSLADTLPVLTYTVPDELPPPEVQATGTPTIQ